MGQRPQTDYDALASAVESMPQGAAEILDLNAVRQSGSWLLAVIRHLFGEIIALAALGLWRSRAYHVVFTHGEIVGIPFALLSCLWRRRPRLVTNAYYLSGRRNAFWYKCLRIHRRIDKVIALSREQYEVGRDMLGIPAHRLMLMDSFGYVDTTFFQAETEEVLDERQICSTGLEFRDYATLIEAAERLPDIRLAIDPASPWSRHRTDVEKLPTPANIKFCHMEIGGARRLYARSAVVAIPLFDNPIGAGTTTLVEAMLGGKAVIATSGRDGAFARRPDLIDGENIVLVAPGDVVGWRVAMERLIVDRELRNRIGANGRSWAQRNADRQRWMKIMMDTLQEVIGRPGPAVRVQTSARSDPGPLRSARENL
jgi:glycosyltransferase involved in cell wall biosynthesis